MNSQHTKGPWTAHRTGQTMRDGYTQAWGVMNIELKQIICGCFHDVSGGEIQAEANARLIAQAPAMYDLILRIKGRIEVDGNYIELKGKVDTILNQLNP